jgi:hypothetical protein
LGGTMIIETIFRDVRVKIAEPLRDGGLDAT